MTMSDVRKAAVREAERFALLRASDVSLVWTLAEADAGVDWDDLEPALNDLQTAMGRLGRVSKYARKEGRA